MIKLLWEFVQSLNRLIAAILLLVAFFFAMNAHENGKDLEALWYMGLTIFFTQIANSK